MTLTQLLGTDPTRHNHGHSTTTMPTMPLNDSLSSEALTAPLDTTMTCQADGQPRILPLPLLRHQPRPQPQLQTQPTNHPPQQDALPTDILWTQQPEQFTDILRTQQQLAHGNESPVFPNEMTLTQLLQTNSTYPNEMTLTQLLQTEPTHRNHATTTTTATTNNSPPTTHNDNATTQPHATSKRQRTERTPPNKTRKRRPTTTTANTDDNHDNNHTPSTGSTNAPIRHTNNQHSPYTGDHRSAFWNSQGLYATDPNKQERKWGYTAHLCNNRDIVGVAETHSNEGKAMGGHPPHDVTTFWSHGTNAVGGESASLSTKPSSAISTHRRRVPGNTSSKAELLDCGSRGQRATWTFTYSTYNRATTPETGNPASRLPTPLQGIWPRLRNDFR